MMRDIIFTSTIKSRKDHQLDMGGKPNVKGVVNPLKEGDERVFRCREDAFRIFVVRIHL